MVNTLDEHTQLAEVAERLAARYPAVPEATIAEVIGDLHAHFNGAPVREFVPMFVERNARRVLDQLTVRSA